ncbi:MAG: hypothetical protein LBU27_05820, partial [Candidatus Peribacteria bacterium]|nr:hypothetical protein [Candidatus Peribacteria bacterium]
PIRPCTAGERDDGSQQRQKTFTTNRSGTVHFTDAVGNQGSTGVEITRIDKEPLRGNVSFTPSMATS